MSAGGFVMVPEWLRRKKPSGNVILAYITLGSFGKFNTSTGTYDECRPSMKRMCSESGLSESAMKRALAELVRIGGARRELKNNDNGSSAPSWYQLIFGEVREPEADPIGREGSASGPLGVQERTPGGPAADPKQEPSTQNQENKISSSCAPSSSSSAVEANLRDQDDDEDARKPKKPKAQKKPSGHDVALDLIAEHGTDITNAEGVYARMLSGFDFDGDWKVVKYPSRYLSGIIRKDGEYKASEFIDHASAAYGEDLGHGEYVAAQVGKKCHGATERDVARIAHAYATALAYGHASSPTVIAVVNRVENGPNRTVPDAYVSALCRLHYLSSEHDEANAA